MRRLPGLAALLLALPFAARAGGEAAVLAEYNARSGSLPPPYAWSVDVTLRTDGQVTLKRCKGYETEGPACRLLTGTAEPARLDAIAAAVAASGLDSRPAAEAQDIPVGGGSVRGRVMLAGAVIELPAFPSEGDRPRVTAVLDAIAAAVPEGLRDQLQGGD